MMRAMYAAISGLQAHQTMLDVTANNLANVNTIGYKPQRTTFVDQLSQVIRGASGTTANNGGTNPLEVGLGVQLGSIDNLMGQGSAQSTGNPLDLQVQGEGFFRVGNGAPPTVPTTITYTRAGNFSTNTLGYLTTQAGAYVIGKNAVATGAAPNITYSPGSHRHLHQHSAGLDRHLRRPGRRRDLRRPERGKRHVPATGDGRLCLARVVPERGRARAPRRLDVAADVELRGRDSRNPGGHRLRRDDLGLSSRCPTSTWPPSSRT